MRMLLSVTILLLAACYAEPNVGPAVSDGWQVLFDGATTDGWEPRGDAQWIVENDYLTTVPGSGDGFLTTTQEFTDFQMRAEFWADSTANGGIYLRVPPTGPGVNPSYEVNVMDAHPDWPTGSINGVALYEDANTVGEWTEFEITVRGNRVSVLLDGEAVAEGEAVRSDRGRIAIQKLGNGVIRYRNISVIPL